MVGFSSLLCLASVSDLYPGYSSLILSFSLSHSLSLSLSLFYFSFRFYFSLSRVIFLLFGLFIILLFVSAKI